MTTQHPKRLSHQGLLWPPKVPRATKSSTLRESILLRNKREMGTTACQSGVSWKDSKNEGVVEKPMHAQERMKTA